MGTWHTDKKIGEIAVLPNGTRVRIVFIRGTKVRLEYINPAPEVMKPLVGERIPASGEGRIDR